ncbi:extracellular solute-binding protein [Horticoccus luteus]|uniref:Extracellular solute-binding protein n=1 Tax=Horticoccus luteus TaxID=2862869 RepID=A0A8F9TWF4_9BACT|nr:extracellular solute-binding protein [Horticoccus luteus]QYM79008.1 extracellular solute-binding protein [Horticoccus luteus]
MALLRVSAHATTLDIPVFAGGYGISFYQETARAFETERPGVTIELYGDPRITDQVRVRLIDGDLPDATLPRDLLLPALVRADKVVDLTPYLDGPNWEGDARWRDTFQPGALEAWRVEHGTYGVPLTYACWSIFYNAGLFRAHGWREPRTWNEFFALCAEMKTAGVVPLSVTGVYGNYPDAFLRSAYYNLAGAEGWAALNRGDPGARTDPRYVRAAGVLQRLMQEDTLTGWEGMTHTAAQLAFLEGRAAMTVSGSWMLNEMKGRIPVGFEIGVMNFPVFVDGLADPTTIQAGADSFIVFATHDPARVQLTIDFLRFLTSRANARRFVREVDAPVAVKGVPLSEFSPGMRPTAAMIDRARDAFNMPQVALQPPATRQALVDARNDLMLGRITPQAFGERVERAAARDRARAADPDSVTMRHPWAGGVLLAALALVVGGFGWRAWMWRRRADAARVEESYFGALRPAVAATFVGPALALYATLTLAPAAVSFVWAFTRWDGLGERTWTGWFNFKWLLFESDLFWAALRNNVFLMVVPAAIVLPTALGFAFLLHRGVFGARFLRGVFLFPNFLGGIAATLLWLCAYEPHGGLVNAGLVALGHLVGSEWLQSFAGFPWLAQSNLYGALVPIYLWMACGFNMVLFLAAMEGIDQQLYEAAEMDGASVVRQFFTITLPLIWDIVAIAVVFLVIGGLNAFEMIWLLTSQDPDSSTHTLGTLMVTSMFKDMQIGRATAIAVMLFVLVIAGSALVLRGFRREASES